MTKYKNAVIEFPHFKQVLSTRPKLYTCERPHPKIRVDGKVCCVLSDTKSISINYLLGLIDGHFDNNCGEDVGGICGEDGAVTHTICREPFGHAGEHCFEPI